MLKIIIIFLLIINLQNSVFGQQQKFPNKLIQRIDRNVDLDYFQEIALNFSNYVDLSKDKNAAKLAIRVCSSDKIELAILKSAVFPPSIFQVFAGIGYFGKKVILLKSSDCISDKKYLATVEIWAVWTDNELPSYSEKYFSDQINVTIISSSNFTYSGNPKYLQNTHRLICELKNDKHLSGYIFGIYFKNPNETVGKLKRVDNLIKKSKLKNLDYHIEILHWTKDFYPSLNPNLKRTNYPAFFLVKILNS